MQIPSQPSVAGDVMPAGVLTTASGDLAVLKTDPGSAAMELRLLLRLLSSRAFPRFLADLNAAALRLNLFFFFLLFFAPYHSDLRSILPCCVDPT